MITLLFDLDGTLVDSSPGILSSFAYAFDKLGIACPDKSELRPFIGPPLETTFGQYFSTPEAVQKAIAIYREYYKVKGIHEVTVYKGVKDCLQELKSLGYTLYVATSKIQSMALELLEEQELLPYFDGVYGSIENRYHKADVIRACLTEEQVLPIDAVMIGDTTFDVIGGQAVGIKTIGVTWGFGLEKDLRDSFPDAICHTPEELLDLFQRQLGPK